MVRMITDWVWISVNLTERWSWAGTRSALCESSTGGVDSAQTHGSEYVYLHVYVLRFGAYLADTDFILYDQ